MGKISQLFCWVLQESLLGLFLQFEFYFFFYKIIDIYDRIYEEKENLRDVFLLTSCYVNFIYPFKLKTLDTLVSKLPYFKVKRIKKNPKLKCLILVAFDMSLEMLTKSQEICYIILINFQPIQWLYFISFLLSN